jgi:signal transduction histidine kinase/CheY-like chemotaxis protein
LCKSLPVPRLKSVKIGIINKEKIRYPQSKEKLQIKIMKNSRSDIAANPPPVSHQLFTEQINALYKHLLVILLINFIVGTMMIFGLWNVVSQSTLVIWGVALLASIIFRVVLYSVYHDSGQHSSARRAARYFVAGSGITGTIWGLAGIVLFPDGALQYQLFILFVLVGMGAGAVTSLTTYMPAFYAYFLPSMLPVCFVLFSLASPIYVSLAVMTVAYVTALSFFGHNINRSFLQSLNLRFENINLVRELSEQKEQAEQANIAKSKFLAAASHDLRQPLHALSLFTAVLDESIQYPKVRKVVEQINASVSALQNLFNALLDISRLEAGVMTVEKTHFELQALLDKLVNDFGPQAREKGLSLLCRPCPYTVYSDPALLEQVLNNYISNAMRYTRNGYIKVDCESNNGQLDIRVMDTGIGIATEDQETIFNEFHQLNNPERDRSKGLGLGLAIVKRIAGLLGHTIDVKSNLNKGSTFSISVDISDEKIVEHDNLRNIALTMDELPNATIIVIDDDISAREGSRALLEAWGYDVIDATDLDDAASALAIHNKKPDGIIADYRLRNDRTGIDAIKELHKIYGSHIPALIVTGDIATDRLREVSSSGYQLLHKPVPAIKLRAFARNVQKRQQKRVEQTAGI